MAQQAASQHNLESIYVAPFQPNPTHQQRDGPTSDVSNGHSSSTNASAPLPRGNTTPVPLNKLKLHPQTVDCPHCKGQHKTRVQGRSKTKKRWMDFWFWPIPGRRHWWETTTWFCESCNKELAKQKNGNELQVVV